MTLFTVNAVSVPTLVKLLLKTFDASVFPVSVFDAAGTVISIAPLKLTPLMLRAVCNIVAVAALPVVLKPDTVCAPGPLLSATAVVPRNIFELPSTPAGIVPVRFAAVKFVRFAPLTVPNDADQVPEVIVPTAVRLDVTTEDFKTVPYSVLESAGTVIFAEPLKFTPLIVRAVFKVDAVVALPA